MTAMRRVERDNHSTYHSHKSIKHVIDLTGVISISDLFTHQSEPDRVAGQPSVGQHSKRCDGSIDFKATSFPASIHVP